MVNGGAPLGVRYRDSVEQGRIESDAAQIAVVGRLDALLAALPAAEGPRSFFSLFAKPRDPPLGLYVYGDVGRGKTMLMDLFFETAPIARKRRVHFHAFMRDVHDRLHAWRQARKAGVMSGDDPIAPVAAQLAADAQLLCFDEFSVRDIADAMILGRLFSALFVAGVVVVATSNVAPEDLYRDGLNRTLFLPFIALLKSKVEVVALEARTDFRLEKLARAPVYWSPDDDAAGAALDAAFLNLAGRSRGVPDVIEVLGRELRIAEADGRIARATFDDLCRAPLGPADHLAIAARYHTLLLAHVPILTADERNAAKRFITLIDALYDSRVKLVVSAAAEPEALGAELDGVEAFEFARCASRLVEMRSSEYLALPHGRHDDARAGDLAGLVDT